MTTLPVLDISKWLQSGSTGQQAFIDELLKTCHDPGFFYLTGHGIPAELDAGILSVTRSFFQLPDEIKTRLAIGNSPHFRGYTILGSEMTAGQHDWREQLDFGPEETALSLAPGDPAWMRLRGPNQWPLVDGFRRTVEQWQQHIEILGLTLMRVLARGLGQSADYFDSRMTPDPYTRLKLIRYPGQPQIEDRSQGLGLHHDSGLFTMILQDGTSGLEIERGGHMISVEPYAGSYVVNLGEMFQVMSNGYLRATPHRVVSPPAGRDRISVACFLNPRLDAIFEPVSLPDHLKLHAQEWQNADAGDPIHTTFGDNTLKIRMRAHPDVTNRFYN